jgi:hypothetical protein
MHHQAIEASAGGGALGLREASELIVLGNTTAVGCGR